MTRVLFHPFHASPSCCSVQECCCDAKCVILCGGVCSVFLVCLILPSRAIALWHRQLLALLVAPNTKFKS